MVLSTFSFSAYSRPAAFRVFRRLMVVLALVFASVSASAQIQTSSNSYTACPNEIITVSMTWPNVGGTTYSITCPAGALPGSSFLGNVASFTISAPGGAGAGPFVYTYTLSGSGTALAGPVTSTVFFNLTIIPPAPLTITNNVFYCPGQTATLTAPLGGTLYNVTGPVNINGVTSNVINIASLGPQHNGQYTITSIGSCTAFGTTSISVAPNTPLGISASTNICQWLQGDPASVVTLTTSLVTATNMAWYSPLNQQIAFSLTGPVLGCNIFTPQPTDAGIYTAYAELPWGTALCPRTATTQVNVVPKDLVTVSASPSNVLCQGTKLNFSAISNGAIGWSWAGPQAFAASLANPNINPVGPLNSGVYTVTALFTNNIITCSQRGTVGINVIGVNQPLIQMPSSACQGTYANMSWNANGANIQSYNILGPNSFSNSIFNPTNNSALNNTVIPNLQPNMSGIYYVTAVFGIGSTTCAATNSIQFNVVPVNTITVVPPNPVCEPANGYLQASATGANSYSWTGPNNFQAYGSNVVVYYPKPNASGVYTVTATFGGGNITCPNTNTVSLTVNPVLNFSLVARQESCYNKPISVSGPSGGTSYSWTASNGFKANTKDIGFSSVQPENSGTYTLVVALGPCTSSASTVIDVLTPVSFTLRPNSRTVCQGDTTILEAGLTGGSQNYAYLWNPSTFMATPDGPKKVTVPLGSMIYNVTAHDIACPNFTVGHSFSVNVNMPPKPDLQLSKTAACAPFCQIYDAKLNGTSAVTTFDFGGSRKYQGDVIRACLNDPGTYSLTIYTTAKGTGCKGRFQFMYPLEVYPRPGATVWWTPENPTPDDEVTLHYGVNNGPVNYFQWSFLGGKPSVLDTAINYNVPGSDTSNLPSPNRRYDKIGTYPLLFVVKNDKECVDSLAKFVKVIDNFNVFIPNTFTPNDDGINDVFMVKGTGIRTDNFSMEITDRAGSPVFSTTDVTEGWNGKSNGKLVKDNVYIYRIRAVGMNGEGRKEFIGKVTVLK